jgi:hypothetical protein
MATTIAREKLKGSVQDRLWTFSKDQALTTSHVSTNVVDLGAHNEDGKIALGTGTRKRLMIVVTQTFASGTSVIFKLQTSEAANMAGAVDIVLTPAIVEAALTAGTTISVDIPEGYKPDRYLGVLYTSSGTHTTGKVSAFIAAN